MKTVVIGGGASGMMAALSAAKIPGNSVILLERAARLGKKLAVTGNGRCNLSNMNMAPENYHGTAPEFALNSLNAFGVSETLDFFRSIGLITVAEPSGRVYPFSDQAGSVVDVLRFALERAGVCVQAPFEVMSVKRTRDGFAVSSADEIINCDKLIVACGGIAGTRAGGTKSGYDILKSLGHSCTKLYPALVQLKTENKYTLPLKGIRADAAVKVLLYDNEIAYSEGEVQFTDYGISGPAVFEIARAAVTAGGNITISLDLMRGLSEDELLPFMYARKNSGLTLENLLTGTLHNKLGRTVISRCGFSLSKPIEELTARDFKAIARTIKHYDLKVTGSMGMDGAQVTAGGIYTDEFDPKTLESRLVPGLFACGEVLDIDGDCGGYNLQWAWSSGHVAGRLGNLEE